MVSRNESRILTHEEAVYLATVFKKVTSHCWYDKDGSRHVFFTGDHCYMYPDLPENVVPSSTYLPMSVTPRPGLEDGIVRTFDDYLRVFEYDSNIHYSKDTASLRLGMPLK